VYGSGCLSRGTLGAMVNLLLVLIILFLLFGGFGYGYRSRLGGYYTGGTGVLGLILIIFLVLVLADAIRL
jgi:hypothetical protein